MKIPAFIHALFLFFILGPASGNNIQITNTTLINNGSNASVQFNITWANSWRTSSTPNNWDAAWIFVKYRDASTGLWQHARLGSGAQHTSPAGSSIATGLLNPGTAFDASTNWGVGIFLYRSANGHGTFAANGVQLRWNYSENGITFAEIAEVKVFAMEMVFIPQGAFAAGSGGSENQAFTLTTITTANANTTPSGVGSLGGQAGGYPTGQSAPNASWPNGFNAFYCMKYELSQQQYVDFLNTLTRTQQNTRTGTEISGTEITDRYVMSNTATVLHRSGIRCDATLPASPIPITFYCDLNGNSMGGEATDGKEIACNYVNWSDLSAYMDWSGLRPMTELEFEKACRGMATPVADEYPWGTTEIAASPYTLTNSGAANEGILTNYSSTLGNMSYAFTRGEIMGPLRVGIYAANGGNSSRVTAGASYHGIMELGGNLYERAVTIGNVEGRAFIGTHGNGALLADGHADTFSWPSPVTAIGSGFRGSAWNEFGWRGQVSERNLNGFISGDGRHGTLGLRGVRHSPQQ